jgi:hypothetical protein
MKRNNEILKPLMIKAKNLRDTYEIPDREINDIEDGLEVVLNNEFIFIGTRCNHEFFTKFDWSGFPEGIIKNTKLYREKGLPHKYVVLADEGDAGFVLMETQDPPKKLSPVIWCDYEDMLNLCAGEKFKYKPDIWPSFTAFFEYLVTEEEKRATEEE